MAIDVPNYRILGILGSGQGSTLYQAESIQTGDLYTIKHVKVQKPEDTRLVDQMKAEHECGSQLDHPALRKTFELRYIRRRLRIKAAMLFMEYVDGETLWSCRNKCSLTQILEILEQAADGLDAMHRAGYVHADIKPGNILVQSGRRAKLIDFGQSASINHAKPRVQGTPDYMAPEQAARQALDARTDVFGLGATLHRVLTGKPVATEMNRNVDMHSLGRVGMRIEDNLPPSLEELPAVIAKLIEDSCSPDRDQRPPTMRDFILRCKTARLVLAKRDETAKPAAEC